MKKILSAVFVFILTIPAFAQVKKNVDYSLFEQKTYDEYGTSLPYRILYPEKIKKGEKYPLVIVLHGMGCRGDDNSKQLTLGGYLFVNEKYRKEYPCIAVYPQAPMAMPFARVKENDKFLLGGWQKFTAEGIRSDNLSVELSVYGKMVYNLIKELCKLKYVDTQRVYIAGVSMGAFTVYQLLAAHPETFAAATTICGATPLRDVKSWGNQVPIRMFHGDSDKVVPVEASRGVYEELENMGVENYKYVEYEGMGHGVWFKAFDEPDFLKWMFMFKK